MSLDLWLAFAAASIALLLIPGPTVLLVLSYALSQGRRVAMAMALGVATGDLIAMSTSLLGLGALIATSATVFAVVKWAGAAYLLWLGLRMLRSRPANAPLPGAVAQVPAGQVFRHAALVTALNPKSIAFFIAFVPQFLRPETALAPQFAVLIATFVSLAALNALAYALLAGRLRDRINRPGVGLWLNRAGGGALIAMAAMTASLRRAM
ncbi:LysE family translocator [Pseudooceanicola sp.]|uniref:LysE family translocator n=1 Tax=Pseudooceanicola sp. TaxID=1914328 RepID=UPI00260BAA0E|nr:LysE family translocator [Pseudooceanicola sp.]MDF1855415.1 LysE family translocator [Pseudooceanicola sp.]